MSPTGISPAMALVTFAALVMGAAVLWVVLLAIVRRVAPRAVRAFNVAAAVAFAALVNFLVFYLSTLLCSAGLKEFLRAQGRQSPNPFIQLMIWFGGAVGRVPVDETHGIPIYALLGTVVAAFSMLSAHLLFVAGAALVRWTEALPAQRAYTALEYEEQGFPPDVAAASADRTILSHTVSRVLAFVAAGLLFYFMVISFDVLLLQIQVAYLSDMAPRGAGGIRIGSGDLPGPEELIRQRAGTAGALVLKGIKWFYVGILLLAAYLWHAAWAGHEALHEQVEAERRLIEEPQPGGVFMAGQIPEGEVPRNDAVDTDVHAAGPQTEAREDGGRLLRRLSSDDLGDSQ